jgi:outer membrane protein
MNFRARTAAVSTLSGALFVSLVTGSGAQAPAGRGTASRQNQLAPQTPAPDPAAALAQPLTLDQAIRLALQNQNTIGIAQVQVQAANARVTQARAQYYPQIAPSYTYSSQLTSQTFNGQRQTGTVEQSVTQISGRLLIFDMGKREQNVAASKQNVRGAEFNVLDARQAVIANVTTNYYELLRRQRLVSVAEQGVARANTTLEATRAFVAAGSAPQKDILQAEADYENSLVQLSVAKNDVRLSMTSLKNAIGVLTAAPVIVPTVDLPTPDATPDTRAPGEYIQQAFNNRSDLKREGAFIQADRHNVKIANINAGFQVQADVTEGFRIDPNPGEQRSFGTSFSYPLFDGGAARAAVRQAKANLETSQRQLEITKQNIQLDVETNYLNKEEARQRIRSTQAALRAAQLNFEAATAAQREGAGTIIDVITAQTQLITADTNAVQALYDFYLSEARLSRAVGANDPYLPGGRNP